MDREAIVVVGNSKGIHLQRFDGGRDLLSPKDTGMLIVDGEIMFGVVDKKLLGPPEEA